MGLETNFDSIDLLNPAFPESGDVLTEADNHMRGIKNAIQGTFPALVGTTNATAASLDATLTLTSDLNGKVNVIGDTMSGNLILDVVSNNDPQLIVRSSFAGRSARFRIVKSVEDVGMELFINAANQIVFRKIDNAGALDANIFTINEANAIVNFTLNPTAPSAPVSDAELTRKDYVVDNFVSTALTSPQEIQGNFTLAKTGTAGDLTIKVLDTAAGQRLNLRNVQVNDGITFQNANGSFTMYKSDGTGNNSLNIFTVNNASQIAQFVKVVRSPTAPAGGNDLTNKTYVDGKVWDEANISKATQFVTPARLEGSATRVIPESGFIVMTSVQDGSPIQVQFNNSGTWVNMGNLSAGNSGTGGGISFMGDGVSYRVFNTGGTGCNYNYLIQMI